MAHLLLVLSIENVENCEARHKCFLRPDSFNTLLWYHVHVEIRDIFDPYMAVCQYLRDSFVGRPEEYQCMSGGCPSRLEFFHDIPYVLAFSRSGYCQVLIFPLDELC